MRRSVKFVGGLAVVMLFATSLPAQKTSGQTLPFIIVGSGVIPKGIPLTPNDIRPHRSVGYASFVGFHTGAGAIEVLENTSPTTADFQSAKPYRFKSIFGRDVLACKYGVTQDAAEPGEVELIPVDPTNPLNDIFIGVFLAEFTPDIPSCKGKFRRLKDGSFLMLAISEPFRATASGGVPLEEDSNGKIDYNWVGLGSLTF